MFRPVSQSIAMPSLRAATLLLLMAPLLARASLITHDFDSAADNATLIGTGGGSGFSGNWGVSTGAGAVTSRIKYDVDANLAYTGGGYAITPSGTGRAYGDFNAFRGLNRQADPDLGGTVWFSLLIQGNSSTAHAGIQFNNHADLPYAGNDYDRGAFDAGIRVDQLEVRYNGVVSTGLQTLAAGQPHLLLGRIVFQDNGLNDRLDVWADPPDLSSLGSPVFSAATGNMGVNLFLPGIFAYGTSNIANTPNAYLDALRLSDGNGNATVAFQEVTGVVPEPGTLGLSLLGLALLFRRRR